MAKPEMVVSKLDRPSDGGSALMKRWQCTNMQGILTVECSDDAVRIRFVYDDYLHHPIQVAIVLQNPEGPTENICEG